MNAPLPWDLYRSFLAVFEHGSLSAASRLLGMTQPTLGRHIDAIEQALGISLFTRSKTGLIPTPAADELLAHAQAMAAAAEAFQRAATRTAGETRGTIRISASEIVGTEVLPPILGGLRERFPALTLELAVSNRVQDLLRRDADIAVRMVRPTQEALVARHIGDIKIGLFAHRRYVERHGIPASTDDLHRHAIIGFDRDDRSVRNIAGLNMDLSREMFAFRCDNDLTQLAALRAGIGIGGMQIPLARSNPDLVRVLAEQVTFRLELWLAMHEDQRASRVIRLTFDHLAEGLSRYVTEEHG